jgi:FAD/FMN-containing dehydrogenase
MAGFDPARRAWLSELTARSHAWPVPKLKGRLLFSGPALAAAADDFGHIVHRIPYAVLEPGDIDDIAVMLRFCSRHRIPTAPRGEGHATFGQAEARHGLVIDMSPLHAIDVDHRAGLGGRTVWAEAGGAGVRDSA